MPFVVAASWLPQGQFSRVHNVIGIKYFLCHFYLSMIGTHPEIDPFGPEGIGARKKTSRMDE
jgi:hypothetical protein